MKYLFRRVTHILSTILMLLVIIAIIGGIAFGVWYFAVEKIQYDIEFELNGGTMTEPKIQTLNIKETYTLPKPTKDGYMFDGWFESIDFSSSKIETICINSFFESHDFTLYAKYLKLYNITYNLDGGTTTNPETILEDTNMLLTSPIKTGYVFDGWYTDVNYLNPITQISKANKDITLYAKWLIAYDITYDLNGGTNNLSNPLFYASEKGASLLPPSREHYTFNGWIDENGQNIDSISIGTIGNIKLTASWYPKTYNISWILNGGNLQSNYTINSYIYGTGIPETNMMKPTADNKIFLGWYMKDNDKETLVEKIDNNFSGDLTLYAKWYNNAVIHRESTNDWDNVVSSIFDNSKEWNGEFFVDIPDELKHFAEKGILGIKVTASFTVIVRTNGDATANVKAYLTLGNNKFLACSTSAKGGGYKLLSGPEMGEISTNHGTISRQILFPDLQPISIGCRYEYNSNKQNILVYGQCKYYCTALSYSFYIAE